MKKALKRITACVLFAAIAVGTLYCLNWLFKLKATDGCYPAQMFYTQEENTIDVLCLGSSHTYSNINPAVLWDEYGMASYDFAGSNQPLWNTYYYFKEALKYQKPELVVLDVYRAVEYLDYQDDARVAMNTFGIQYSEDWKEALEVSLEEEDSYLDYLLRYPVYHSRYQEFKKQDFLPYNGDYNQDNYKGFNLNCISTTYYESFPDVSGVLDVGVMTEKTEEYLLKIIELAEEEDIPLLLVSAPYMGITVEDKMIYNQIELIAEEYGVHFIDFNEYYNEIGFDPATDFAESSHLNYYGSEKYTRFLGRYISDNYEVTDRRGDEKYASWDANSEFYRKHAENVDLKKTAVLEEYFEKLFKNADRYTICVSTKGQYADDKDNMITLLNKYGMDAHEECVWVFEGGELVYTLPATIDEDSFFYEDMGKDSLTVMTEMRYSKMIEEYYPFLGIYIEGIGCDAAANGVNIIVYDNELQTIVDNVGLDATTAYSFLRY